MNAVRSLTPGTVAATAVAVPVVVGTAVVAPWVLLPVAGLLALFTVAPLLRRLADGAAWSLPVLVGVAVLLVDTAGRTLAPGPWRYVATAVVVGTILLIGVRPDQRSALLRTTALALFAYGLLGTLYGRLVLGTENGALPLIGPLVIACLPPVRNWGARPDWRLGLRVLAAVCALFAVFSGLARMGVLPETHVDVLNHEKAFLVVLGIAAAVSARDRMLVVCTAGAAVFAFVQYPAATYPLAAAVAVGTLLLARWAPCSGLRVVLAAGVMVSTAMAVAYIDALIRLTASYFRLVGKTDNGSTRAALYRAALDSFDSPVFGSLFTGDITVVGTLSGENQVVPVHNDYLSIALGGGVVAAAFLVGLFLLANGMVLRSLPDLVDPLQRRTAVILLGAVNAAAVSAFANPIFMNPGSSALTYALLAALVAACRVPPNDRAPQDTDVEEPPARPDEVDPLLRVTPRRGGPRSTQRITSQG